MFVDAAARELTGQSLAPDNWHVPWFLVTQSNYSQGTGYAPITPESGQPGEADLEEVAGPADPL